MKWLPYLKTCGRLAVLDPILEAQWIDLRERLIKEGSLSNMIPLVDVSGSMSGTPMEVAISLGILISEVTHTSSFQNQFLTFSSNPKWHRLKPHSSLLEKVLDTREAEWGMSTDFSKALLCILDKCKKDEICAEEVAQMQLVVLSDMQFDAARSSKYSKVSWETQYEELCRLYTEANSEYSVPGVIFWNLRGDTHDFPVQSNTPGVDLVSGFSPNMLKLFMNGERPQDPWTTLRTALDATRYDAVRKVCATVQEKELEGYTY